MGTLTLVFLETHKTPTVTDGMEVDTDLGWQGNHIQLCCVTHLLIH